MALWDYGCYNKQLNLYSVAQITLSNSYNWNCFIWIIIAWLILYAHNIHFIDTIHNICHSARRY